MNNEVESPVLNEALGLLSVPHKGLGRINITNITEGRPKDVPLAPITPSYETWNTWRN